MKIYRAYRENPKFGPKLLPEVLKMSQNFSLFESSKLTPDYHSHTGLLELRDNYKEDYKNL